MGLGLNVDRGRVMGVAITAMEAYLARVLNKLRVLSKQEGGRRKMFKWEGDSSRSPRLNEVPSQLFGNVNRHA